MMMMMMMMIIIIIIIIIIITRLWNRPICTSFATQQWIACADGLLWWSPSQLLATICHMCCVREQLSFNRYRMSRTTSATWLLAIYQLSPSTLQPCMYLYESSTRRISSAIGLLYAKSLILEPHTWLHVSHLYHQPSLWVVNFVAVASPSVGMSDWFLMTLELHDMWSNKCHVRGTRHYRVARHVEQKVSCPRPATQTQQMGFNTTSLPSFNLYCVCIVHHRSVNLYRARWLER